MLQANAPVNSTGKKGIITESKRNQKRRGKDYGGYNVKGVAAVLKLFCGADVLLLVGNAEFSRVRPTPRRLEPSSIFPSLLTVE